MKIYKLQIYPSLMVIKEVSGVKIYSEVCPLCSEEIISLDKLSLKEEYKKHYSYCKHYFAEKLVKKRIVYDKNKLRSILNIANH